MIIYLILFVCHIYNNFYYVLFIFISLLKLFFHTKAIYFSLLFILVFVLFTALIFHILKS